MKAKVVLSVLCNFFVAGSVWAFPVGDNLSNNVIGQTDFTTGYADINSDQFFGARATSSSTFFLPYDVAYDATRETLYVADMHNHRVLSFATSPSTVTNGMAATNVFGQPDFVTGGSSAGDPYGNRNTLNSGAGCNTAINACGMQRVYNVAVDTTNNRLFVADADNNRVLVWDLNGTSAAATYVLGQATFTTNTRNLPCGGAGTAKPNTCGLNFPTGLAWDGTNSRLYVTDQNNHRVVVYNLASGITNGMAASAEFGQAGFVTATKNAPCGGGVSGATNRCGMDSPNSVAIIPSRNLLLVSDWGNHRILTFDVTTFTNGTIAANVLGQPNFTTKTTNTACGGGSSGDSNTNACGLGPLEAMVDVAGSNELFISDVANHRIMRFDITSITDGEAATSVMGQANFTTGYNANVVGFGGSTTQNRHVFPDGIAYDATEDRLFLADGGNHRILLYGSNVEGSPVSFGSLAQNVSTTTTSDGDTQITLQDGNSHTFVITFPEGTTNTGGDITISPLPQQQLGTAHSGILIENASLPAGTFKSVQLTKSGSKVCIYDHASFDAVNHNNCNFTGYDSINMPSAGACRSATVNGDLGDNPSVPSDTLGRHSVTACLNSAGTLVTVTGLRHSAVLLDDGFSPQPQQDEFIPDFDDNGNPINPNDGDSEGGCSVTKGSRALWGITWLLLVLLAGSRRRNWSSLLSKT